MRQGQQYIGHTQGVLDTSNKVKSQNNNDFVLEKSIFNNVFEKDIKRIYIYKKAERLAKALHLIAPAFAGSATLRARIDAISFDLVDAAILPSGTARVALSRELLALSSVLAIARTSGALSAMNADLIAHETHLLLQEVAEYEEPRLVLDDTPSLAHLAKTALHQTPVPATKHTPNKRASRVVGLSPGASDVKDISDISDIKDTRIEERRDAILSVIKNKQQASIKDISTHIRTVSEKTIQRELSALITAGIVRKEGERRWSTYSLI